MERQFKARGRAALIGRRVFALGVGGGVVCWAGCSLTAVEPTKTLGQGYVIRPVVDQSAYVRFAARALSRTPEGIKRTIEGVDDVHAQTDETPRGPVVSFIGPDIPSLERAFESLKNHPQAPKMPEELSPVFIRHEDVMSMVFVDHSQGFELSPSSTLSLESLQKYQPVQVRIDVPAEQVEALRRLTSARQVARVAVVAEQRIAMSAPVVPGTLAKGVVFVHHHWGTAEALLERLRQPSEMASRSMGLR